MENSNNLYENIGNELSLGKLNSVENIQTLWSGYGKIVRLIFDKNSIIVKHIKLPKPSSHPRGWNTDFSHKRKLKSYEVEVNFYQYFAQNIDKNCPVPKGYKTFKNQNEWLIVMEDLASIGFTKTTNYVKKSHLLSCIKYLANFHSKYMNVKTDLLWEIGTYWHLDTRPDELKKLENYDLKKYAKKIDKILNNAKYQTIVHGDAKLANFCFNEDGTLCAAVDFQYVGHGCGIKDLAYFMSSAVEPKFCQDMESWILDVYFRELKKALKIYQPQIDCDEIQKEWKKLFYIAWADFNRFIEGWNSNHFKINDYTNNLTKKALDYLKSSEDTLT